ncbi:MAG: sulfite exporter TauE/SafE family protein [Candidatus Hydrothermarchaeota archaeon]
MLDLYLPSQVAGITFNPLVVLGYGVLVGIITGLLGVGGGTLVVPFLSLYLGLPIRLAIGTSLFQITGIAASGAYQHFKLGSSDLKLAAVLASSGAFMAYVGAVVSRFIPADLLKGVFGVFVIVIAYKFMQTKKAPLKAATVVPRPVSIPPPIQQQVFFSFLPVNMITHYVPMDIHRQSRSGEYDINVPKMVLLGGGVGLFSGILGVGGGFLLVPGLVFLGIPIKVAVGTDLAQIVASSIVGASTYYSNGDVALSIGLLLMAGGVVGTVIGAKLNRKIPSATLRRLFGFIMIPLGLLMVKSALGY